MVPGLRDWRSAAMVAVSELVSGLDAELVRLGYKASTMVWYRGCWRRLERLFASRGVQELSLDLAMAWVDHACGGFFAKEQAGTLKPTDVYLFRVAQMLNDFAVHGAVLRRYSRTVGRSECVRWVLRQGAGRHAQADRCVLVPRRADAQRFRGAWGGAAPLFPHRGQADWRRDRHAGEVPGVAAGCRPRRVDGAGLWHGGRRVPRFYRRARRPGWVGCRGHRRVRGHPGWLSGQDGGAQTVRRT